MKTHSMECMRKREHVNLLNRLTKAIDRQALYDAGSFSKDMVAIRVGDCGEEGDGKVNKSEEIGRASCRERV